MKTSIKELLKFVFHIVKRLFAYFPTFFPKKNIVLILRTDNIGDYILFRNFLEILRGSSDYKNKQLILVGNDNWRDIAEHFDTEWVDTFFWINRRRYHASILYRIKTLVKLRTLKAYEVINTVHSRDAFVEDLIVFSGASVRVTCEGDNVNNRLNKHPLTKFDRVIPSLPNSNFEFYRNKFFFENLTNTRIDMKKPNFDIVRKATKENQILIFSGATEARRRWSSTNFAELINLLGTYNSSLQFFILGGQEDITLGDTVLKSSLNALTVQNRCGQTSLIQLIEIIAESRLLISNETSAVHIAAATDTPTVCISNGNHFGRFNPYPLSISDKILTLYPNNFFYDENQYLSLSQVYQYKSELEINDINPKSVFDSVVSLLSRI